MFRILVLVMSLAGEPQGISFSIQSYDAQQCALNMLAATREVMKDFADKKVVTQTRCVPKEQADALEAKLKKQNAPTDKLYDL